MICERKGNDTYHSNRHPNCWRSSCDCHHSSSRSEPAYCRRGRFVYMPPNHQILSQQYFVYYLHNNAYIYTPSNSLF